LYNGWNNYHIEKCSHIHANTKLIGEAIAYFHG